MIQSPPTAALLHRIHHAADHAWYSLENLHEDNRLLDESCRQLTAALRAVETIQGHLSTCYEFEHGGLEPKGRQ